MWLKFNHASRAIAHVAVAIFLYTFVISAFLVACSPPKGDLGGGSEDDYALDSNLSSDIEVSSIANLKSLYNDNPYLITQDIAITGVVTANDVYGELPNSLVIEDYSGAIELKFDDDVNCFDLGFIVGSTAKISCNGLWLGSTGGMLSLGATPYDQYPTSELSLSEFLLHVRLCNDSPIIPEPISIKISELKTDHILRYVKVDNLSVILSDESCTTFCSRSEESGRTEYTQHTLLDTQGSEIILVVDREVRYADDSLPIDLFSVCAIVEYFNGEYRLRIVNCSY